MTDYTTFSIASRWKRLAGSIIDSIAALTILLPVIYFTGLFEQIESGQPMTTVQYLFFFIMGWIIFMALNGYLLSSRGQTIGKYVVGTRIVDFEGNLLPFNRLFLYRYMVMGLLVQIPVLGIFIQTGNILYIFSPQSRCVHDLIAGTIVIDTQSAF